jgi:hypothetical protein
MSMMMIEAGLLAGRSCSVGHHEIMPEKNLMKKSLALIRGLALAAVMAAALGVTAVSVPAAESEEGFVPMCNGKDLTGWEGKEGWWRIEDGAITSESTKEKPCLKHNYLMWRGGKPGDFELRCDYRVVGGNSGIQFRSKELPDWDTWGFQADMEDGNQWTGCLFHHQRGGVAMRGEKVVIARDGKKEIKPLGDPKELLQKVKKGEWNSYRIIARGSEMSLEINGTLMCQVTDNKEGALREGVIALQMHPGPPMKVQFRNLRIKMLPPLNAAAAVKP